MEKEILLLEEYAEKFNKMNEADYSPHVLKMFKWHPMKKNNISYNDAEDKRLIYYYAENPNNGATVYARLSKVNKDVVQHPRKGLYLFTVEDDDDNAYLGFEGYGMQFNNWDEAEKTFKKITGINNPKLLKENNSVIINEGDKIKGPYIVVVLGKGGVGAHKIEIVDIIDNLSKKEAIEKSNKMTKKGIMVDAVELNDWIKNGEDNYTPIHEDEIKGGKGDKLKPEDVDATQLKIGIAVEAEHALSEELRQEIALDHLAENPEYYTILIKSGLVDEEEALTLAKELLGVEPIEATE